MKIIFRANDIIEAHIVAGMLRANDIHAYVGGHYLQGGVGELSLAGFATVAVDDHDIDIAMKIVGEYDATAAQHLDERDLQAGDMANEPKPA